jgi:hypothetical protein
VSSIRDILDAIRGLPRPDRLRLVEELNHELETEGASAVSEPPPGSRLELRDGFYVYNGPIAGHAFDHRLDREERIDQLIGRIDARRT